jgi:hypothetical protein
MNEKSLENLIQAYGGPVKLLRNAKQRPARTEMPVAIFLLLKGKGEMV